MKKTDEQLKEWRESVNGRYALGSGLNLSGGMTINDLFDTIDARDTELTTLREGMRELVEKWKKNMAAYADCEGYEGSNSSDSENRGTFETYKFCIDELESLKRKP